MRSLIVASLFLFIPLSAATAGLSDACDGVCPSPQLGFISLDKIKNEKLVEASNSVVRLHQAGNPVGSRAAGVVVADGSEILTVAHGPFRDFILFIVGQAKARSATAAEVHRELMRENPTMPTLHAMGLQISDSELNSLSNSRTKIDGIFVEFEMVQYFFNNYEQIKRFGFPDYADGIVRLKLNQEIAEPLEISETPLEEINELFILGYPAPVERPIPLSGSGGKKLYITSGKPVRLEEVLGLWHQVYPEKEELIQEYAERHVRPHLVNSETLMNSKIYYTTADTWPGMSGGAVVDSSGKLLGISQGFIFYVGDPNDLANPEKTSETQFSTIFSLQ